MNGWNCPLVGLAEEALTAAGETDCVLRFLWTPDTGLALVSALPDDLEELRARGLRLRVCEWSTGALAGAKSTSYAENMAAQADAVEHDSDTLHTPSLELPILAGVTRGVLLSVRPTEEGRYPLDRLLAADEVFLTSTVREVMPVAAVDGRTFELGPAARELQAALRGYAGAR